MLRLMDVMKIMAEQKTRINVPVTRRRYRLAKAHAVARGLQWEAVIDEALALWIEAAERRGDVRVSIRRTRSGT